ncbi:MAG: hypothetical protein L0Y54_06340 [Sporichthyaceae bacterium]|nr:hypothetical protein [Sporichthyaceae bacterium]
MLLVAGGSEAGTLDDIWSWDGSSWTRLAEHALPPRQAHGLAYDSRREVVVLTGGLDQPGTAARHQDVWESAGPDGFERVYPAG